jgi:HPt (histidine-containing phosphotransfer) domain-containing protein
MITNAYVHTREMGMEILNLARLDESSGGDSALASELLAEFANFLSIEAPRVGQALIAGDLNATRMIAHTINGASLSIGAELISSVSVGLEQACKEGDETSAFSLIRELQSEVGKFSGWFSEWKERAA